MVMKNIANNANSVIQVICRNYLERIKPIAKRYGLLNWVNETIADNLNGKCSSTEEECEMLARICDEERLARKDVPRVLGKSYRQCIECEDFEKIKKLKRVGIYSFVDTLLLKNDGKL